MEKSVRASSPNRQFRQTNSIFQDKDKSKKIENLLTPATVRYRDGDRKLKNGLISDEKNLSKSHFNNISVPKNYALHLSNSSVSKSNKPIDIKHDKHFNTLSESSSSYSSSGNEDDDDGSTTGSCSSSTSVSDTTNSSSNSSEGNQVNIADDFFNGINNKVEKTNFQEKGNQSGTIVFPQVFTKKSKVTNKKQESIEKSVFNDRESKQLDENWGFAAVAKKNIDIFNKYNDNNYSMLARKSKNNDNIKNLKMFVTRPITSECLSKSLHKETLFREQNKFANPIDVNREENSLCLNKNKDGDTNFDNEFKKNKSSFKLIQLSQNDCKTISSSKKSFDFVDEIGSNFIQENNLQNNEGKSFFNKNYIY